MNKILIRILIVVIVSVAVIGAGNAYFSGGNFGIGETAASSELSTKVFCPDTRKLNPNYGFDATNQGEGSKQLKKNDLDKLEFGLTDNQKYNTNKWDSAYGEKYLELGFPNIKNSDIVDSAILKFEWQRSEKINGARLQISGDNGSSWVNIDLSPLPAIGLDRVASINLFDYGIDSAAKVNNLKIRFQAISTSADGEKKTKHNWVEIIVGLNPTNPGRAPKWCNGEFGPIFSVGENIAPGDASAVPATVRIKNTGNMNGDLKFRIKNVANSEGSNTEAETGNLEEPGELGDNLRLTLVLGSTTVTGTINELKNFLRPLGAIPAGQEVNVAVSWELPVAVGNEIQGDSVSFDVDFVSERNGNGGGNNNNNNED